MEGPILAEFSSLNALNQRSSQHGQSGSRTERSDRSERARSLPHHILGSRTERSDRSQTTDDALGQHERLLRGESTYTAALCDGRASEHFIDDQPQVQHFGVSHALPKASTDEERERLMRRLEMCAKAREESTKIMSVQFAQRDAKKTEMRRERQLYTEKLTASARDREERWGRKLQRSPFAVDLVAENQRIDEENRVRDHVEQRRQRLIAKRNREAHNYIFKRATAETDELDQLRTEKRLLLENERQLKALRDVERSNARTAQILQERRRLQQMKQQNQLQQAGTGAVQGWAQRTPREA
mmetsp:Transcript_15784/g.43500  ORF Transcript_15784/g.43500 Transcript_15784/m.43500 type:complete len:300 (-) Transcript_15784:86-985(-)|eukprot:CAMPEP_0179121020 /NCGR_PEP_ID=MMETSP0796-20121207/57051_1 /TAXON_ID=73915 /ORGANISM="Pyrodinium bahamense, Strain pbaha01" /LENGTH=299 /DNA_ID=CAMNT_0020819591 /DNA_START=86 /DNA_END=985 /DNA_ORIENTATION=-